MEATATERGGSLPTHQPPKKWGSIADHHPVLDPLDEELENLKSGQSDERTIYEVQQGREPFDMDFCSISIDGNLNSDILQQRLHGIARQRDELQQMEIELRAQIIARSEIFNMQNKFDCQIKEHNITMIKLQEQLRGREQTICELERKVEDKDRELHAIKLDNEAAWAKEDLFREQDEELATYRRERDHSEAERSQHVKQIHDFQEHILEKERQIIELQEQHRVSQETIIYKDEQLREAHAWIARVWDMDALHSTTNHSLQAELRERTEQYNQLWVGCQRQFAEMERLHLHSIQQLQLELADARERSGTFNDGSGSQTSQTNLKDDSQYGKTNGPQLDTNGISIASGNTWALSNESSHDVLSFSSTGNALSQGDQVPSVPPAPSLLGVPTYLTSGQVTAIHPFLMHRQGVPQSIVSHFHSAPISSFQQWQSQLPIPENDLQLSQNDQELKRSTAKANYEMSVTGPGLHSDYLNGQNGEIGKHDSAILPSTEGAQVDSIDQRLLIVSQPEQSLQHVSSQFRNALRLDTLEHKTEAQEKNASTSNDYADGKTLNGVGLSSTVDKSPPDVTPHSINLTECAIDETPGPVPREAFASNSLRVRMPTETPILDERSLLACIVRTIPAGGKIQISSTLPNRLVKMLAPLHWHDYQKKYGKLDDFVASHPELFMIEGDFIQLREGAQEIIAATAAVAKVAAAAAAPSPDSSYLPSVAVTPMAQTYRLRKIPSVHFENCSIVQSEQLNGVCFGTSTGLSSVKLLSKSDNRELNIPDSKAGQLSVHMGVRNGTIFDRYSASSNQNIGSTNGRPGNNMTGKHQGRMAGAALPSRRLETGISYGFGFAENHVKDKELVQ